MKRILALLLCLVLALTLIPAAAAEDIEIVTVEPAEELIAIVDPEPAETMAEPIPNKIIAEGKCGDDLKWELNDSGTLEIFGTGEMWDFPDDPPSYAAYADKVERVYFSYGVTGIGSWAFYEDYVNLKEVDFSSTITSIGNSAFKGSGLVEVSFPEALETIVGWAFEDCPLTQIAFHGDAPDLNFACFNNVTATVFYPKGNSTWTKAKIKDYYLNHHINGDAEDPADGTLTWEKVNFCGDFAYWEIKDRTLTIYGTGMVQASAEEGESMFIPIMDQFDDVYITDGKEGIGAWSFAGLTNMKTCRIPAGMDKIVMGAFMSSGLTEFTFPDAPRLVMENLFYNCKSLKNVYCLGDPTGYGWGTYEGVTATIYYPADNPNWSEELIQSFYTDYQIVGSGPDGLTWVAVSKPSVTSQPSDQSGAAGDTLKFTVKASGGALKYQWYFRKSSDGSWTKCSGTGATAKTLSVEAKSYRSGYQYRCRVSNFLGYKYSKAATLTVTEMTKPAITTQPSDKTASAGQTVKFTVKATGGSLSYQWYYRKNSSGSWAKCSGDSAATASLSVEAKSYRSGYQYRCKVTNAKGYVYSSAATLTVSAKPTITLQPTDATAAKGETVSFKVKASNAESYQWYYRTPADGTWKKCSGDSATSPILQVEAKSYRSGYQYRCKVSNADGYVYTNAATLTVQ